MGACAQIAVFTFAYAANALLCLYSVAAWAQEIGTSFSVPFFRLNVGTDDRSKLLCTLLLLNYYLSSGHFFFCIYPF